MPSLASTVWPFDSVSLLGVSGASPEAKSSSGTCSNISSATGNCSASLSASEPISMPAACSLASSSDQATFTTMSTDTSA